MVIAMSALEDAYEDILQKAQRGMGLTDPELVERSGLSIKAIEAAKSGHFDPEAAGRLAECLGLDPEALRHIAAGGYRPEVHLPEGVKAFTTHAPVPGYEEMTVNAYLVFDPASRNAALFDTGTSLHAVREYVEMESLNVQYVVLTHTHPDHVQALDEARTLFPKARYLGPEGEPYDDVERVRPFNSFAIGALKVEARLTPGHSPAGTTYLISGLSAPVAVVGDAIFAGSIGGVPPEKYHEALKAINGHILANPPETLLLPGHRSPTTVEQEKRNNPFFAGRS